PGAVSADRVISTIDEELGRLAEDGLAAGELDRVKARIATQLLREVDAVLGRTLVMAAFEQQRGTAELVGQLPALIGRVDEASVVAAAATLAPQRRAVLEIVPGGRS
ncbi:MAG: hypothetical protein WCB04_15720, partial [Mycobacteriales bacterium]